LASLRELQLAEAEGKLLKASEAAEVWNGAVIRLRNAVLAIPARVAARFADPRHAEAIVRAECEMALAFLIQSEYTPRQKASPSLTRLCLSIPSLAKRANYSRDGVRSVTVQLERPFGL